ncbi:MAG: hypothetical protein AMXMBFR47_40040 [Planctomycetota bacterium]
MNKNFLGLIEAHIEKGVLGLSAVVLLLTVWMFGLSSPNTVEFSGKSLSAGELSNEILDSAKQLKSAMSGARPDDEAKKTTQNFAKRLTDLQSNVLFSENRPVAAAEGKSPPPLKPLAVVTTIPGKTIEVEGLKESEEISKSIELVTPLPPSSPVVRTGRNLVERKPIVLGAAAKPPAADAKADAPVELSWVTVAAYFDKQNQQAALHQANYSTGRARVYVAGVDVERQELLSNGEWSEWKRIDNSKANPELSIPQPAIDERGNLINKTELDEAWSTVKAEQQRIMQPPFYPVTSGDMWKMPPLEGHEDPVEEAEERPRPVKRTEERTRPTRNTGGRAPAGGGGRGGMIGGARGGGGGGEIGISGGGGGRFGGRGGGAAGGGGGMSAADKAAAKKEASEKLKEAKEAMSKKDYGAAISAAQQVTANEHASAGDKRQAEGIIADAEKKMAEAPRGAGPVGEFGPRGAGPIGEFGPRGAAMPMGDDPRMGGARGMFAAPQEAGAVELVTHPENKNELAVWFHDDTVEPGKTYQYRMRVNLWNRYMGRLKALKNADDAKKAIVEGEWSAPSDPVIVAPSTHFFVTSLKPGTETAVVEVWKWRQGTWHKQNFEASVGEMIGGEKEIKVDDPDAKGGRATVDFTTGAVILDLRVEEPIQMRLPAKGGGYNLAERKSLVLVYLDPADGQVKERVQDFDRTDPIRKLLQAQEK